MRSRASRACPAICAASDAGARLSALDKCVARKPAECDTSIPVSDCRPAADVTTETALASGIHPRDLYAARDSGNIAELSHGVFRRADAPLASFPDLLAVAYRNQGSCLRALGCSRPRPHRRDTPAVEIAVPRSSRPPRISFPPARVFRFEPSTFELGLTHLEAAPSGSRRRPSWLLSGYGAIRGGHGLVGGGILEVNALPGGISRGDIDAAGAGFPEPVIPAYRPVPWPMVNLPLSVWVNRQVLDAEPEPEFSDSLSVNVPPGRTISPPPRRGTSYPPAVKAPLAITLSRCDPPGCSRS